MISYQSGDEGIDDGLSDGTAVEGIGDEISIQAGGEGIGN